MNQEHSSAQLDQIRGIVISVLNIGYRQYISLQYYIPNTRCQAVYCDMTLKTEYNISVIPVK